RLDCRRHLLHGNIGHHLVEDRSHGLDEFWTVVRHDALSSFAATEISMTPRTSSLVPARAATHWIPVLRGMSGGDMLDRRVAGSAFTRQTQSRERHHARVRF